MCKTRASCVFFAFFPTFSLRFQVMSQPRRSACLAARFQSTRSSPSQPPQPMAIDLTDTEPISDGLSDDPVLSEVDMSPALPASSVTGTSLLPGRSLVASCNVALFSSTCSVSPIWRICLLNLSSAPPATLSPLPLWTSSTSSTCAVFVKWRLLQASA